MSNDVMYIFTVEMEKSGFTSIEKVTIDSFLKVNTTQYISINKLLKMMKLYNTNIKSTCNKLNIDFDMVNEDCRNIRGIMVRQKFAHGSEGLFAVTTDAELDREGLQSVIDMHFEDGTIEKFLKDSHIGDHTDKLK